MTRTIIAVGRALAALVAHRQAPAPAFFAPRAHQAAVLFCRGLHRYQPGGALPRGWHCNFLSLVFETYIEEKKQTQQQQQQQQSLHSRGVPFASDDASLSTRRHHPTSGEVGHALSLGRYHYPNPAIPPYAVRTPHCMEHRLRRKPDRFYVTSHIRSSIRLCIELYCIENAPSRDCFARDTEHASQPDASIPRSRNIYIYKVFNACYMSIVYVILAVYVYINVYMYIEGWGWW